jgi:hypothetical protein
MSRWCLDRFTVTFDEAIEQILAAFEPLGPNTRRR